MTTEEEKDEEDRPPPFDNNDPEEGEAEAKPVTPQASIARGGENSNAILDKEQRAVDGDAAAAADGGGVTPERERRSLNSYYGHRMGFWQSLSLILNAGVMVYAHVGLSAVILSNQERISEQIPAATQPPGSNITNNDTAFNLTGSCTLQDLERWNTGGALNKTKESNYCAREYQSSGCLLNKECTTECFVNVWNYTAPCASCFADIPICSLQTGCAFICNADGESEECSVCNEPCSVIFDECSGLPRPVIEESNATAPTTAPTVLNDSDANSLSASETSEEVCERQQEDIDVEDVEEFYVVYDLQFWSAIETAWTSDAQLLAVIVMLFSGIWPYAKNIILALAWYLPLRVQRRDWILMWLRRLGKYTLVDVYVVIVLMIGVLLVINVADDVPLVIKAEPRPAIIAFLVATVWEFVQIEWMVGLHEKLFSDQDHKDKIQRMAPKWYRTGVHKGSLLARLSMVCLVAIAVGLYLSGSILEAVRFTSVLTGETGGCVRSYNLYSIFTTLISDFFLYANSAKPAVWTLALSYLLFLAIFPLFVHLVHGMAFLFDYRNRRLSVLADQSWTFASVEILALAIFTVEFKFSSLIASLAGEEGSQFFGIETALGPGFYVLIAYSVFGGMLHYYFNVRVLLDGDKPDQKYEIAEL